MRAVRLKSRRRVGVKMFSLVYLKTVERTGVRIGGARKIPVGFSFQRMKRPLRVFLRTFFQDKIDIVRLRGPDPKVGLVRANQFGADRITAGGCRRGHESFSRGSYFAAVPFSDFSFPA